MLKAKCLLNQVLDVQDVNVDIWIVDVHLDVPIVVDVLVGLDAEVIVIILDLAVLLDDVGFDEPIVLVVL